jgi:tetratricopeptide (TPR) repeat protein
LPTKIDMEAPMNVTTSRAQALLRAASLGFALGLTLAVPGALASAGGGNGEEQSGASQDKSKANSDTTCERGKVWDAKAHKCLAQHSGVLPDDQLADYAYALAKAERYQDAIEVLDLSQNPNTPKALNYRGYVTRKLGRIDEGIGYYLKSVALDPNYAQVREYLGEAYVIQGKFELAKQQLTAIRAICGSNSCDEYDDLERAIVYAQGL